MKEYLFRGKSVKTGHLRDYLVSKNKTVDYGLPISERDS